MTDLNSARYPEHSPGPSPSHLHSSAKVEPKTPSHILILGSGVFALTTLYELLLRPRYASTRFTIVSPTLPEIFCEASESMVSSSSSSQPARSESQPTTAIPSSTSLSISTPQTLPDHQQQSTPHHPTQTASHDINRIIRSDYADPLYAQLAREAQTLWRDLAAGWGAEGRYNEVGLLLSAGSDDSAGSGADDETGLLRGCHGTDPGSSPPTSVNKGAGTGTTYLQHALHNALSQEPLQNPPSTFPSQRIQSLSSAAAIEEAMRAPGKANGTGEMGSINPRSGWADAGACMRWLEGRVAQEGKGRVRFSRGEAVGLVIEDDEDGRRRVIGAKVSVPKRTTTTTTTSQTSTPQTTMIHADLTLLATGAHTPSLLTNSFLSASPPSSSSSLPPSTLIPSPILPKTPIPFSPHGQPVLYIPLSAAEALSIQNIPVHMNLSTGCFVFPPTRTRTQPDPELDKPDPESGKLDLKLDKPENGATDTVGGWKGWEIKVARHGFGYTGRKARRRVVVVVAGKSKSKSKTEEGEEKEEEERKEEDEGGVVVRKPWFPNRIPKSDRDLLLDFARRALPFLDLAPASASSSSSYSLVRSSSGKSSSSPVTSSSLTTTTTTSPMTATPHSTPLENRTLGERICWYLDTRSGDFVVSTVPGVDSDFACTMANDNENDESEAGDTTTTTSTATTEAKKPKPKPNSPQYPSLFITTAGSGHAFKFLPVLGRRIVDVLELRAGCGSLSSSSSSSPSSPSPRTEKESDERVSKERRRGEEDEETHQWARRWAWPGAFSRSSEVDGTHDDDDRDDDDDDNDDEEDGRNEDEDGEEVWCLDGSRAGVRGVRLEEALADCW